MADEFLTAFERLDERKTQVVGAENMDGPGALNDMGGRAEAEQGIRLLFSGFDVNFEDLDRAGDRAGDVAMQLLLEAAATGHYPGAALKAFWFDAVLIGLLVAEQREKART